jgi:hypothetical protein
VAGSGDRQKFLIYLGKLGIIPDQDIFLEEVNLENATTTGGYKGFTDSG